MDSKLIFSFDGGGIRGIIPLWVLASLEAFFQKRVNEAIHFCGGTSTGAVIASGIAVGVPALEMIDLYHSLGPRIFRDNWIRWLIKLGLYRFETGPLAEEIRRYAGDRRLNDLPIDILLTAVRVKDSRLWWFVKDNPGNSRITGNLPVVDCTTASAAAPIFFKPWPVPTIGECVDGGIGFAQNPVFQSCVEAFRYTAGSYEPNHTIVVSFGTGHYRGSRAPRNIFDMARFSFGSIFGSTAELQTSLVAEFIEPRALYRIDTELPYNIGLDDLAAIPVLDELGRDLASQVDWESIFSGEDNRWKIKLATK